MAAKEQRNPRLNDRTTTRLHIHNTVHRIHADSDSICVCVREYCDSVECGEGCKMNRKPLKPGSDL